MMCSEILVVIQMLNYLQTPIPIQPLFANSRSFFSFVYAAVSAVGTVAINEKPCAGKFPKPPKKINKGILTIPPPIPSRPDSIPENTPINKYKKIFPSYCEE